MRDNYQTVTDRIVAMLSNGVRPWSQPWNAGQAGGRPLRENGKPYQGANTLNLWAASMERGFNSAHWLTFKAATDAGAKVRKGAKAELAFYVGKFVKEAENAAGETVEKTIPFLKAYPVFNADEIEGLPEKFYWKPPVATLADGERSESADAWIVGTGARIVIGGNKPFYRPSTDDVHMPDFAYFASPAGYYSTAFHELTHWSGAAKRLDRLKGKLFGDPAYAFEELVAELGAAYVSADLGIAPEPREDHAAYIASWLAVLKHDNRAIFQAASLAERAAGFLHDLQPKAEAEAIAA